MVEKVNYVVLEKINSIEIRKYPEMILALVKNYDDDSGFGVLFNYISGYNKKQEKIKMTAPVINSEKIEMTSPVISQDNYMAFIMPSKYNKNNIPIPLDSRIKIKVESEKILAIIRFGGYSSNNKIEKFKDILLSELEKNNIKTKGNPLLMRYNSPFAPPFIRRNEIGVEIEYDKV
jgi:hypothetical protein